MTLAPSAGVDLRRTQIRTKRAKVHEAGENYNPEVLAVDYIATIELGEPVLDTRVNAAQNKELTRKPSANQ